MIGLEGGERRGGDDVWCFLLFCSVRLLASGQARSGRMLMCACVCVTWGWVFSAVWTLYLLPYLP